MNKRKEIIIIGLILFLATFLRFYRIYETAPFLGDQGRDLLEIRESLLSGKIPLSGPLSNLGLHAGPAYYYLIIPSLLLTNFHPIGPTVFITSLGVISTFLIYYLGKNLFGFLPGLLAAAIYASSPIVIERTRGIWNPALVPFFVLLVVLCLFKIQEKRRLVWFLPLGLFLSLAVQLYPPAWCLLPIILGWWFLFLRPRGVHSPAPHRARGTASTPGASWGLAGLGAFFICLSPFLLFQIQNDFVDIRNLLLAIIQSTPILTSQPVHHPHSFAYLFLDFFGRQFSAFTTIRPTWLNASLGMLILTFPFLSNTKEEVVETTPTSFPRKRESIRNKICVCLYRFPIPGLAPLAGTGKLRMTEPAFFWRLFFSFWLIGGVALFTLYPGPVFDHYLCFVWPISFLLFASFVGWLEKILSKRAILAIGIVLVVFQTSTYFTRLSLRNDLSQTELMADAITQIAKGEAFYLVLQSPKSPSDTHLRYFLQLKQANLKSTTSQEANWLLVVCDQGNCPPPELIQDSEIRESECLTTCPLPGEQKTIDLKKWQFVSHNLTPDFQIYLFKKS